jgi:hypothetical protein
VDVTIALNEKGQALVSIMKTYKVEPGLIPLVQTRLNQEVQAISPSRILNESGIRIEDMGSSLNQSSLGAVTLIRLIMSGMTTTAGGATSFYPEDILLALNQTNITLDSLEITFPSSATSPSGTGTYTAYESSYLWENVKPGMLSAISVSYSLQGEVAPSEGGGMPPELILLLLLVPAPIAFLLIKNLDKIKAKLGRGKKGGKEGRLEKLAEHTGELGGGKEESLKELEERAPEEGKEEGGGGALDMLKEDLEKETE